MRGIAFHLVLGLLAPALLAGCGRDTAPADLEPLRIDAPAGAGPVDFADLATVLAAVREGDAVEPTALAVQLPRLERQLAALARPWPAAASEPGSDARLAWLYNARTAWSLRLIARELRPTEQRERTYALPETIAAERLWRSPFELDGRTTTLAAIDEELASWDDFRVAAAAPGATDWEGPLPAEPFAPPTVRAQIAPRFEAYVRDPRRIVVDVEGRRLRLPPALRSLAPRVLAEYERRYGAAGVSLATALTPHLDVRGRDRMEDALGYPPAGREGEPGIVWAAGRPGRPMRLLRPESRPAEQREERGSQDGVD